MKVGKDAGDLAIEGDPLNPVLFPLPRALQASELLGVEFGFLFVCQLRDWGRRAWILAEIRIDSR
jgi:hypothetical protein